MKRFAKTIWAFIFALICASCVQNPTEESNTSDLRPGISFSSSNSGTAKVVVDGLEMGLVRDYPAGKKWLKLVTGTHRIQVIDGESILLDETIYLGDAVNKSIRIN